MATADIWELERQRRAAEKAAKDQKKKDMDDYEEIFYAGLAKNSWAQVRLLGNPMGYRDGDPAVGIEPDPTSAKKVYISWILGDDKRKFMCLWPDKDTNPEWILWRVMKLVMSYKWNRGLSQKDYLYQQTNPECFLRVARNNDTKSTYENGWYPTSYAVMNCIDRLQMKKHRELKHTAIFSKVNLGKTKDKDGKEVPSYFYDRGVPMSIYDGAFDLVRAYGPFTQYDLVVRRNDEKPYYIIKHPDYRKEFIVDFPQFDAALADAELSAEELGWARYNLDELYPVTSYKTILAKLRTFLAQVDAEFGTTFLTELIELEAAEAAAAGQQAAEAPVTKDYGAPSQGFTPVEVVSFPETPVAPAPVVAAPVAAAPVAQAPVGRTPSAPVGRTPSAAPAAAGDPRRQALEAAGYKHQSKIPDHLLDLIDSVNAQGEIVWADIEVDGQMQQPELYNCGACKLGTPTEFTSCPKCGAIF